MTLTREQIEAGARELFRIGNERIGVRKWEDVGHFYIAEAEACLSAAQRAAEPGREMWRPIETAPKDGTRFDAWQRDERVTDVFWSDIQDAWCVESDYPDEPTPLAIIPPVTHWRPLPKGPASSGNMEASDAILVLVQRLRQAPCGVVECGQTKQCETTRGGECPNALRHEAADMLECLG